jgi:hypothetical protein
VRLLIHRSLREFLNTRAKTGALRDSKQVVPGSIETIPQQVGDAAEIGALLSSD